MRRVPAKQRDMSQSDNAVRLRRVSRESLSPGPPRPYIEETISLDVRFSEVDALQVVWHGHYANYFEEARRAFGRKHGVDYLAFMERRLAVPVIHLRIDYLAPARLADALLVRARLHKSETARLDFDYEIRRQDDATLLAVGSTSQVFTTASGELLPTWPSFMRDILSAWEPLWKTP